MPTDSKRRLLRYFSENERIGTNGADAGKLPEGKLWASFKRGDEAAFIQLYQQYASVLFNYGCQFSADREMVKDCLQDFFIYLRKNRAGFGDPASVKMYLFKAFKRRVLDYLKKYRKECQHHEAMMFSHFPVEMSNETIFINRQIEEEQIARLNKALKALNPKEREAIFYFYYEGLSYDQIAEIFGFSHVSSARRLVYRALGQLKKFVLLFLAFVFLFAIHGCSKNERETTAPRRPNTLLFIADDASFREASMKGK